MSSRPVDRPADVNVDVTETGAARRTCHVVWRKMRQIGVRFDANIDPRLPWKFVPEQETVRIHPGARTTIYYDATNYTARSTTGQAIFNVTPEIAGKYFSKIECFCFTEQTLKPGQSVKMPVVFFVDPKLRQDPDTKVIDEITLSYTFYPVENPESAR